MRKCIFRINPAVLLGLMTDGRNLLTVENGVTPGRDKRLKKVMLDQRDGTIVIAYDQEELIHMPGDLPHMVNPQFKLVAVPENIDTLVTQIEQIADLCIEKLGAPKDTDFDIARFLRDEVVPYFEGAKARVN
jgi:hypothetical protein